MPRPNVNPFPDKMEPSVVASGDNVIDQFVDYDKILYRFIKMYQSKKMKIRNDRKFQEYTIYYIVFFANHESL